MSEGERKLRAAAASNSYWSSCDDRAAHTAPGRKAFAEKFERQVDPDNKLTPEERARRAEHARKAYFAKLALKSAKARRLRSGAA